MLVYGVPSKEAGSAIWGLWFYFVDRDKFFLRLFGFARLFGLNEEENLVNQNQRVNLYINANENTFR